MPLYSFEIYHPDTGEVVVHFDVPLPVAQRDKLALRRNGIPETLAIANSAPSPDVDANLRVLYRAEQRMGSTTEFHRKIGFAPEEYKRVWKDAKPDHD